jgi:chemotaxis protein histidine kinase CheA
MVKKILQKKVKRPNVLVEVLEPRFMMSADVPGADILTPTQEVQDLDTQGQELIESAQTQYEETQSAQTTQTPSDQTSSDEAKESGTTSEESTTVEQTVEPDEESDQEQETQETLQESTTPSVDQESTQEETTSNSDLEPEPAQEVLEEPDLIQEVEQSTELEDNTPVVEEETQQRDPVVDSVEVVEDPQLLEGVDAEEETDLLDATESVSEPRNEIVFVNDNVLDYEQLIEDIPQESSARTLEVVVIDATVSGVQQVSDLLSEREDIDALHIISYGSSGFFSLGNEWLDEEELLAHKQTLAEWGETLSEDADILIYGCSVASDEEGEALSRTLAELTGADVSTSDDITGHEDFGGDWELEYVTVTPPVEPA